MWLGMGGRVSLGKIRELAPEAGGECGHISTHSPLPEFYREWDGAHTG
jgi:hypothetical protein